MSRKDRNFYQAKNLAATSATTSTTDYSAPTVGLEDQVFTYGKAKDAAKFEVAKEELGKNLLPIPVTMELMLNGPLRPQSIPFISNQMSLLSPLYSFTI